MAIYFGRMQARQPEKASGTNAHALPNSSRQRTARYLALFLVTAAAACASDSAATRTGNTLEHWASTIAPLNALVAIARTSQLSTQATSGEERSTIRSPSSAQEAARSGHMTKRQYRSTTLSRALVAEVNSSLPGQFALREIGGTSITVQRVGSGPSSAKREAGSLIETNAFSDTDAALFGNGEGIEDLLFARSSRVDIAYRISLPNGWRLFQPTGADWLTEVRDAQGAARFRVRAENAWDSNAVRVDVRLVVEGSTLHVQTPREAHYPIAIDPIWESTGMMVRPRRYPTIASLSNGKVLVLGSTDFFGLADIFDPKSGTFTISNNSPPALFGPTCTPLANGTVLVAGGLPNFPDAYVYDVSTNEFTLAAPMHSARSLHAAARLRNGEVLVVGGYTGAWTAAGGPVTASAEIYNPQKKAFRLVGLMRSPRQGHTATLLPNGNVLVVGGDSGDGNALQSAEVFDPLTETFTTSIPTRVARSESMNAVALPDGRILVSGGLGSAAQPLLEIYEPANGAFAPAAGAGPAWSAMAATLLQTGRILLCGGQDFGVSLLSKCKEYDPVSQRTIAELDLLESRAFAASALLPTGTVLLVGGAGMAGNLRSAEILEAPLGESSSHASLVSARESMTATELESGDVLVAGGVISSGVVYSASSTAEILNKGKLTSREIAPLSTPRSDHTSSRLTSGKVLIVGGTADEAGALASAEIFDPKSETFSSTGAMGQARVDHTATVLKSGKVLVTGGADSPTGNWLASAEIYDPATGIFTPVGNMTGPRIAHTASLLPTGKVLIVGVRLDQLNTPSADLFDPDTEQFLTTAAPSFARLNHTATTLLDGDVLIAGGALYEPILDAERFDHLAEAFVPAGQLAAARQAHSATLLPSGKVLIAGGVPNLTSAELYEPSAPSFTNAGSMTTPRGYHSAVLRNDGSVALFGGLVSPSTAVAGIDIYDPASHTFSAAKSTFAARANPTLSPLSSGGVMIAGGRTDSPPYLAVPAVGVATSVIEIYQPETNSFMAGGHLSSARYWHSATTLADGGPLLVGGWGTSSTLSSMETYNPVSHVSSYLSNLQVGRSLHTATWLPSGSVLIAGGYIGGTSDIDVPELEVIDPRTGTSRVVKPKLTSGRIGHSATLLEDGTVAIVGGHTGTNDLAQDVAIFDPATETLSSGGTAGIGESIASALSGHEILTGDYLTDGTLYRINTRGQNASTLVSPLSRVFGANPVPGGLIALSGRASAATFDPATTALSAFFSNSVDVGVEGNRSSETRSGDLFTFSNLANSIQASAELRSMIPSNAPRPIITPWPQATPPQVAVGADFTLRGSRFTTPSCVGAEAALPSTEIVPVVSFLPANGGLPVFAVATAWTDTSITAHFPPTVYVGPGYLHVIVRGIPSVGQFANLVGSSQGTSCSYDGECVPVVVDGKANNSGLCVDGFCCESSCQGACQACSADKQDPTANPTNGKCLAAKRGTNPKNACATEASSTCGQTGVCRGDTPACAVYPDGTDCPDGKCVKGACSVGGTCDGSNLVPAPGEAPISCGAYTCRDRRCLASCTSNVDCATGLTCTLTGQCASVPFAGDNGDSGGCNVSRTTSVTDRSGLALAGLASIASLAFARRRRQRRSDRSRRAA